MMTLTVPMHVPVLSKEVDTFLGQNCESNFLDMTLGFGGHAEIILKDKPPSFRYIGIDRDPEAIEFCKARFESDPRISILNSNHDDVWGNETFEQAKASFAPIGFESILADLGVSTYQLKKAERGFSFSKEGPLDMRMDNKNGLTALEWIQRQDESTLAYALWIYGEERASRPIARSILKMLELGQLQTTLDLARAVYQVLPLEIAKRKGHSNPATKTFQAIRIAVNGELDRLNYTLQNAFKNLAPLGRMGVISFHSLEDRIVKHTFRKMAGIYDGPGRLSPTKLIKEAEILTPNGVVPEVSEIESNPSSRSARLRVISKL
jgi:16S rRNA (cytosine1402-N4)-methyltransferase